MITNPSKELIRRMAIAMKAEAAKFSDPVQLYVESEWYSRNPIRSLEDYIDDADLRSWEYLVNAALQPLIDEMNKPSSRPFDAQAWAEWNATIDKAMA